MSSIIEVQRVMLEFVEEELGETGAVIECSKRNEEDGGGWFGVVRTVHEDAERLRKAGQSDMLAIYEMEVDDVGAVVSYKRKFSRVAGSPPERGGTTRWHVQRL
jgi:hypothetical protein